MIKPILLMIFACGILAAQTAPTQPGPTAAADTPQNLIFATSALSMPGAPGGAISIVAHESSFLFGKAVKGAPYSADQVTEHVETLADGNRIVNTTTTKVYRDSQGRTRTEATLPALPGSPTPPVMITIHDAVAGFTYFLNPETKTAQKMVAKPIEAQNGENPTTLPPLPPLAPGAGAGPIMITTAGAFPKPDVQTQDLGSQTIEGLAVKGTRMTATIPAGAVGNEQPIETVSERWFAPALQVVVKSVNTDPRIGQTTETLNNLSRAEPDPSLFQIPSDYTTTETKGPDVKTFLYRKSQ